MRTALPVFLAAAMLCTLPATAEETAVPADAQQDMALTIYSGGFTVVQDTRRIRMAEGENVLAWEDVSRQAQAGTAMFSVVDGPAMTLIEQTFDFDLLTPERLLAHSVGQDVTVVQRNPATGERIEETARVLSTNGGLVLKIGERYHTQAPGRIVFHELPGGLRTRPTLVAHIRSERAGPADLRLTYHTEGLGWSANYVGTLDEAAGRLTLESRIELGNRTGIAYRDAALRLVAGEVRQAPARAARGPALGAARMEAADTASELDTGGADFHVFGIERPVTLENNQTKQIGFLPAMEIDVTQEYRFDGSDRYYRGAFDRNIRNNAAVWLTFENTEQAGAGRALAAGTLRVYRDVAGRTTFVGGATIGNTPVGESVREQLGSAFDITSERVQTEFDIVRPRRRDEPAIVTAAYRLTVRNAKDRDVEVIITEPIAGDWEMLEESAEHERLSANRVEWRLTVPAGGETELTYRVRYHH